VILLSISGELMAIFIDSSDPKEIKELSVGAS
jgi:hypothetical protein